MLIEEFGFPPERVKVLQGGFPAWREGGYPVEITVAVQPKGKRFILWGRMKSARRM
jgi:3-mercaptopyruvate sulfurtransferase SseA